MRYRVTFTDGRIGRSRGNEPLEVDVALAHPSAIADTIAEAVFRHAKKKLASKWFDVSVALVPAASNPDMDPPTTGSVSIEAGRFGSGTVELLAS